MAATQEYYVITYNGETIMNPSSPDTPLYFNTYQEAQDYVNNNLDIQYPNYYCINVQTVVL